MKANKIIPMMLKLLGNLCYLGIVILFLGCSIFRPSSVSFFNKEFISDFTDESFTNKHFAILHHQWGGANGGVSRENVHLQDGKVILNANGDLYAGPIQGVARKTSLPQFHEHKEDPKYGQPWTNRVGGAIMFRKKTGFGSYRVVAKLPAELGVASAFWTFFYNELYPDDPHYDQLKKEGLHEQGNKETGRYIVRNHEIDMEFPSHLPGQKLYQPSLQNVKLNVWRGELKSWGLSEDDPNYWEEFQEGLTPTGVNVGDGKFHEFRFDWYADSVLFFIDGKRLRKVENKPGSNTIPDIAGYFTMGVWFPSAPLAGKPWLADPKRSWAGGSIGQDGGMKANFETVQMEILRFTFHPFKDQKGLRILQETYQPNIKGQFISKGDK